MEYVNKTTVKEFILLAFHNVRPFQILLFILVLLTYTICLTGNIVIIILVKANQSLHKPMYFFISTFAFLEIMFTSVTNPKLLTNLIAADQSISFVGCLVQLYAFNALGETEGYLLAVMAFDRDLAINNPLRYSTIMNHSFCSKLALFPWVVGFIVALLPTIFTARLDFCGPNVLNHFFCDLAPLQNLSCSNPFISNVVTSIAAVVTIVLSFIFIIGVYIHILITICKIHSAKGKQKAFSTCSSHLVVSGLLFGSAIIVYVKPKGSQYDKFLALIYTVIIPLLNPFIYTLRNKEVKRALCASMRQMFSHI